MNCATHCALCGEPLARSVHDEELLQGVLVNPLHDEIHVEPCPCETRMPPPCMVASQWTGGEFYCTRGAGHDGPCAAHPIPTLRSMMEVMMSGAVV